MAVSESRRVGPLRISLVAAATGLAAVWAYYPTLRGLVTVWSTDPNYSQGFLVPVLALGLFWQRVRTSPPVTAPAPRPGLGLLAVAAALRGAGAYFYITPLDHLSILAVIAGMTLLFGGWAWLGRAWPGLVVLGFMFPIPTSVGGSNLVTGLQSAATAASTFALQTLGVVAAREGNVILLRGNELGIVEACSGLRMLMVFCALATVTAALVPAGWVRKSIVVASAVPLAMSCNMIRITAAGIASESLGTDAGYFVFHDLAGWLMVPLAFVLLGAELVVLSKLFRADGRAHAGPPPAGRPAAV